MRNDVYSNEWEFQTDLFKTFSLYVNLRTPNYAPFLYISVFWSFTEQCRRFTGPLKPILVILRHYRLCWDHDSCGKSSEKTLFYKPCVGLDQPFVAHIVLEVPNKLLFT